MEMHIFTDREHKIVYFSNEEDKIDAYYNKNIASDSDDEEEELQSDDEDNEHVGDLELATREKGEIWLYQVHVNQEYQQQGIGTNLIKFSKDLELEKINCVQHTFHGDDFSLTTEGDILIASCIRKGIITPDMCVFDCSSYDYGNVGAAILKRDPHFFDVRSGNESEQGSNDSGYSPESEGEISQELEKVSSEETGKEDVAPKQKQKKFTHLMQKDSPLSKKSPKKDDSDYSNYNVKESHFSLKK
jgi:GNAT superfamily N-acetyltransferase